MSGGGFVSNAYNTQLLSCCDDRPTCLEGWCCPWCQVASQQNALMFASLLPGRMRCTAAAALLLGDVVCLGLLLRFRTFQMRTQVKSAYGIEGESDLRSCCVGFWCVWCSTTQVHREMSIRHQWPGGACVGGTPFRKYGIEAPQNVTMDSQRFVAQQLAALQAAQRQVLLQALEQHNGEASHASTTVATHPHMVAQQLSAMMALQQYQIAQQQPAASQ